ncbi:UNVERIFIED_CONTAM: hypothetical protein Slati_3428700 [Sesamum latifolium]|uniref:Uncharacterized protein n=1 Tax=Sesamum latifolium TaxID=2727402 RepID=A0AAW2UHB9_9LAMI
MSRQQGYESIRLLGGLKECEGKVEWLQDEDMNTRFSNMKVSAKCQNTISKVKNNVGEWYSKQEDIQQVISTYFSDIFSLANPPSFVIDEVVPSVSLKVDERMNRVLLAFFHEKMWRGPS